MPRRINNNISISRVEWMRIGNELGWLPDIPLRSDVEDEEGYSTSTSSSSSESTEDNKEDDNTISNIEIRRMPVVTPEEFEKEL